MIAMITSAISGGIGVIALIKPLPEYNSPKKIAEKKYANWCIHS